METATLSTTAKRLTLEELGLLQRRTNEIVRRIEEGTITFEWAKKETQRIIEGREPPEVETRYQASAKSLQFNWPSSKERKQSRAPVSRRLPHYRERLNWPSRTPEHVMVEMWEATCIPKSYVNSGQTPIESILGENKPTKRDVEIVNSTIQWLGTNVGREFLRRYVRATEMWLG
jgi:hypothetical protein